jgi:predicted nucleic acid-binding protein
MIDSIDEQRALVDTNVVVYAYDVREAVRHIRAQELLSKLSVSGRLVFSVQVLNEFSSVLLRPGGIAALPPDQVADRIRNLAATGEVVPLTASMTLLALDAVAQYGLSFWDGLIWAAARENGVPLVYTEDFQHGRVVEGIHFVNPFLHTGP